MKDSYQNAITTVQELCTLLLVIFDFQKFAELKTHEKKFSRKLTTRKLIPC